MFFRRLNRFAFLIPAVIGFSCCPLQAGIIDGIDLSGAQINLDFEGENPMSGGAYVGIVDDGTGNHALRLVESEVGYANNFAYLTSRNVGSQSIVGSFDIRFSNAVADGASFILAGDSVDVTHNYGTTPVGESPNFTGSFGIGYTIYNKNKISLHWDGKEITAQDLGTNYNFKNGQWLTTQFHITFSASGTGANVLVDLLEKGTGNLVTSLNFHSTDMSYYGNQLLLRGRTGGSKTNADFDNIQVLYTDLDPSSLLTWKANQSGALMDGVNWSTGAAPVVGEIGYINAGTQTISNFNLPQNITIEALATINADGTVQISKGAALVVGQGANLNLNVPDGDALQIGTNGDGATFSLMEGTVTITAGKTILGQGGKASMMLKSGKFITSDGIVVGNGTNASTLTQNGSELRVGNGITVKNGSTASFNALGVIDSNPTAGGEGGYLMVGATTASDSNFLTVENGATASTNRTLRIGNGAGSSGTVNVYGTLNATGSHTIVGWQGSGTINVDGGKLTTANTILGDNAGGACVGVINVINGGTMTANEVSIGDKETANGTINLAGAGSTIRVNGKLYIAGKQEAGNTSIGLLTQAGASLLTANEFHTKNNATYRMGGDTRTLISVNSNSIAFNDDFRETYKPGIMYIGIDAEKIGKLAHTGGRIFIPQLIVNEGSQVDLNAGTVIDSDTAQESTTNSVNVGLSTNSTSNRVEVNNATLNVSGRSTFVGRNSGSYGEIIVNGGTLKLSSQTNYIGDNGTGTVSLQDATFSSGLLHIGNGESGVGTLTMDNTTATVSNTVNVGNSGRGDLAMTNGSAMTVAGSFMLGNNESSTGSTLLLDNSTLTVNGEHMIFGRSSRCTVTMRGENASIDFNGTGVCGLGEFGTGIFNMEGGTFNVNTLPKSYNGFTVGRDSILNQTGGTMNIGKDGLNIDLKVQSTSQYNLSGDGVLNVTGTFSKEADAAFNMTGGTLTANKIDFDFTQLGGTLVIDGTTTIAKDYTLGKDAKIVFDLNLDSGMNDKLILAGNTLFEDGAKVELAYDNSLIREGLEFDLIQFETSKSFDLAGLEFALPEYDQNIWDITVANGKVHFSFNASAVPEPSTFALLLLALGTIFGVQRLRIRKEI